MENYQIDSKIGGGAYGRVYRCVHKISGEYYAMKKIRIQENDEESDDDEGSVEDDENDNDEVDNKRFFGISTNTLREISILKNVQKEKHENIIE
jgi:serine/threonine protein kinase